MVVPQTSQTALTAFLPFFMVTSCASFPSLLARHLTQYIIMIHPPSIRQISNSRTLGLFDPVFSPG